ncbi:AAA family ATPase [Fictibacillus enclensis]|uniref:AAA family ATPase n=1 Tax=Fictibacillus enclensis TaxID=1017270 RepID=UPI0024BF9B07|nr:AAA family ATPase [Fictibacillus enclensis]WHY71005.1 AAA family ATPase [Fictibacillus enclensis]
MNEQVSIKGACFIFSCGKTTLARQLSDRLGIPSYELDNIVWKRSLSGDIKRSEAERDQYLNEIIHSSAWIIEGVHTEWVDSSFKQANVILVLDTPYSKRIYRIVKRFVLQKLGIEKSNYRPTFEIFIFNTFTVSRLSVC